MTAFPQLITFAIVELEVNRPTYGFDLATQSPMSDFQGDVGVEKVAIGDYENPKMMLGVDDHDTLKVKVLTPLPQRVTLLAVLNARAQPPRKIAAQPDL